MDGELEDTDLAELSGVMESLNMDDDAFHPDLVGDFSKRKIDACVDVGRSLEWQQEEFCREG